MKLTDALKQRVFACGWDNDRKLDLLITKKKDTLYLTLGLDGVVFADLGDFRLGEGDTIELRESVPLPLEWDSSCG